MGTHTAISNRALRSKVFHVNCYTGEEGLFFATSPDLEGLLVAERSISALMEAVPQAIVDLYKACGEDIIVTAVDQGNETGLWVGIPIEIAVRELAKRASHHT